MTKDQMWEMQFRLDTLRMAHAAASPETLVETIIETADKYYKFLKEGVTTNE